MAVVEPAMTAGWEPVRGVPGGLAVRAQDGSLARYDLERGQVVDYLGEGSATLADVIHDRVAWCATDPCEQLRLEGGEPSDVASLGSDETFSPEAVWLSPGGRFLAADVWTRLADGARDHRLRIYDLATGDISADGQMLLGGVRGAWDSSGEQFFAWLVFPDHGGGPGPRVLSRWVRGEGIAQVDMQGVLSDELSFVVLRRDAVGDPSQWQTTATSP